MANPNPQIAAELERTKEQLANLKAEKARLYPANPHPFVEPDAFPSKYTPDQIRQRNQIIAQIEQLENRIQDLQDRLYTG